MELQHGYETHLGSFRVQQPSILVVQHCLQATNTVLRITLIFPGWQVNYFARSKLPLNEPPYKLTQLSQPVTVLNLQCKANGDVCVLSGGEL